MRSLAVVICLTAPTVAAAASKCYALALSGGGDKGAWQVGVIKGLVERMKSTPEERQWSVVTGVSVGSFAASGAALFDVGQEEEMVQFVVDAMLNLTNSPGTPRVYKAWPSGVDPQKQTGLFNTEPLYDTILATLSQGKLGNRKLAIAATDDVTGLITVWDETSVQDASGALDYDQWATYVRASMAVPAAFESVKVGGTVYSDGGVVLGTNVFSAVKRCQDEGFSEQDIVVDVVTCDSEKLSTWNEKLDDLSYPLFTRGREVAAFNHQMSDLLDACLAYPNLGWRYYVQAPSDLPSHGTAFNGPQMQEMMQMGLASAATAPTGIHCQVAEAHRHSKTIPQGPPVARTSKKCYALAVSGGGSKGAYEAGVIQGLVGRMAGAPVERQWQIVTGISAGSILASGAALFDVGDEVAMSEYLVNSILNFTNVPAPAGVYVNWPGGWIQGLLETGLFDTKPLYNSLVTTLSGRKLGNRKFTIGATNNVKGTLSVWDETSVQLANGAIDYGLWATYIRASAAEPGAFQSVSVDGVVHSDGGDVIGANIFAGVTRCKAAGYAEEDIVVDMVTCNSDRLATWNETVDDVASELNDRTQVVQQFSQSMADIRDACLAYPNVTWRYFVQAPVDLPDSSNFDGTIMKKMVQIGLQDAASAKTGTQCSLAEQHRHSKIIPNPRPAQKARPAMPIVV